MTQTFPSLVAFRVENPFVPSAPAAGVTRPNTGLPSPDAVDWEYRFTAVWHELPERYHTEHDAMVFLEALCQRAGIFGGRLGSLRE